MPWDTDIDVQVSASTLSNLAAHLNRTRHDYIYVDDTTGAEYMSTYLLDINPHHNEDGPGDGQNVIDGRWIDTTNGAYIDITGVAEGRLASEPGVWSCRGGHRYTASELFPLRETEFEGLPAHVPYGFKRALSSEYGYKCFVITRWAG